MDCFGVSLVAFGIMGNVVIVEDGCCCCSRCCCWLRHGQFFPAVGLVLFLREFFSKWFHSGERGVLVSRGENCGATDLHWFFH